MLIKKQKRLWITISNSAADDIAEICEYYQAPIQRIILDDVIDVIKRRRAALPLKKAS